MAGERRALLVATDTYTDPGLTQLRAPTGDVEALSSVLEDPAIGGFTVKRVFNAPAVDVKQEIEGFFDEARLQDLLLLYISGHGVLSHKRLYFAASTTLLKRLRATAIEDSFVSEVIEHSRARSKVLILDCCHSGAFTKGFVPKSTTSINLAHRFEGHGSVTITASGELEYAFEETDPEHLEDRGALSPGSVFTRCLVEGLQSGGADLDRDGRVSIDELYDYVYARVRERSPQQTPSKAGAGHGDIIIARSPRTATLPAELRDALENPVAAIRETALRELADMRRTATPGVVAAIEEALHRAMQDDSRRVSECARQLLGGEAPPPPATTAASEPPPTPSEPEPRSKPGTLRVDQRGHGDHRTLAEALAAATPGTQILVNAGVYVETASLSVPGVEIRGEGQREDIVVRAPEGEPAVIVTATSTHVSGLTLQTTTKRGRLRRLMTARSACIEVRQGSVQVEACAFTGGAGPGLTVHPNAHVSLADSIIARANGAGVSFMPSSSGTLERNGISECAGAGVLIRAEVEATLRRNRIHDNRGTGITVQGPAGGVFEDNDISANEQPGIVVVSGNPTFRNNAIHDGKQRGVHVYLAGRGVFEGNRIVGNAMPGFAVTGGGDPTVRNNTISEGGSCGVLVADNGTGTFEGNDIGANTSSGIEVRKGGDPVVRDNRVHDGKAAGIFVHTNGRGTFEANDIFGNQSVNFAVSSGADPSVRKSKIHDGEDAGVHVYDNGQGTFEDNDIVGNRGGHVVVRTGGDPVVRNNRLRDGRSNGVRVHDDGRGTFEGNDISGSVASGFAVSTGGDPTVRDNTIRDGHDVGIDVFDQGCGTFERNLVFGNAIEVRITDSTPVGLSNET